MNTSAQNERAAIHRLLTYGCNGGLDVTTTTALVALLRRDWAVRVLDAVARASWVGSFRTEPEDVSGEQVWFCHDDERGFRGPTPDAARHAAALAVFPTLPEAVRAEIGECP